MTGMELYVRFMVSLAVGLCGCGVVMTTLFETVLRDWDPSRDFRRWWRLMTHSRSHAADVRAEDILQQLESKGIGSFAAAGPLDRRYDSSRALREGERAAAPLA